MPPLIDWEVCTLCGTCADRCPLDVIYLEDDEVVVKFPDECWHCGACRQDCPVEAISIEFPMIMLRV